jgi:aspartate aminotransferase
VTAKTKIFILNSAANPTGVVYTRSELEKILKFAYDNNILVISDEVYSGLVYDHHQYISCGEFKKYLSHIIIIQSCSKSFSMTGWRLGFVFADKILINQLTVLLGQSTSGVTTISQWAGVEAFIQAKKINNWINATMQKRRNILLKALKKYFNIIITPPASGLYLFIELKKLGIKSLNSAEFCQQALEQANVVLVPGSAFGKEGFVRFSFGGLEEDLISGIKALSDFVAVCSQRALNTQ